LLFLLLLVPFLLFLLVLIFLVLVFVTAAACLVSGAVLRRELERG
jgi:hypothetical protein